MKNTTLFVKLKAFCLLLAFVAPLSQVAQNPDSKSIASFSDLSFGDPPDGIECYYEMWEGVHCFIINNPPPGQVEIPDFNYINEGGIGLDGIDFMAALSFQSTELLVYHGWEMGEIKFFPILIANPSSYVFKIWEDENLVYEQPVLEVEWNEWNTVPLTIPHVIDAGYNLIFGFDVTSGEGESPLGHDPGPALPGLDLIYFFGDWYSLATDFGLDYNWNIIGVLTETLNEVSEKKQLVEQPVAIVPSQFTPTIQRISLPPAAYPDPKLEFLGINYYRDGQLLNSAPTMDLEYFDAFNQAGTYIYTAKAVYDDGLSEPCPGDEVLINVPEIDVTPIYLEEIHEPAPQITTQPLYITNTGFSDLEWSIEIDLGGTESLQNNAMDAEEYARLVEARQAVEGQPNADVQYGVIAGQPVFNGDHYTNYINSNNTRAILWDNGPMVTAEGVGPGGSDYSELQDASLGMGTYGSGAQINPGNSIADDFEVASNWNVTTITFFGYQTGSTTQSTFTEAYVKIYDGDPSAGGAVIFGDFTTNRLQSTQWTNIYRVLESAPGTTRPIMEIVTDVSGLTLAAGTYWVEVTLAGTGVSGPWIPPVTIVGQTTTGNSIQLTFAGWEPLVDFGPQGMPFIIEGTTGTQPANDIALQAIVSPVSGVELGIQDVTITLKNNGSDAQSNIPWEVSWTGPLSGSLSGTFIGPLAAGASETITVGTADISAFGDYVFEACANNPGDELPDNNCKTKVLFNSEPSLCVDNLYTSGCLYGDGLISWSLANINVANIPCEGTPPWYHDYRNQVHEFQAGQTYTLTVQASYNDTNFDVWIDWNGDYILTDDELVLNDGVCATANTTYTFNITIPTTAPNGTFVMRFRTNWISFVLHACETYTYGNAADFKAQIGGGSGGDGWLAVDQYQGIIPPGETETITVTFDSDGLTNDVFGEIHVLSNDLNNPLIVVPVTLLPGDISQPNPPKNLTVVGYSYGGIQLAWFPPDFFNPVWLTYSGAVITNSIGTNAAVQFDVAARFTPAQLEDFTNGVITKINFVPGEPETFSSYTLKIWQGAGNPTLIYQQPLTGITADVWNEITLTTPVPFDNTQELWFGFGVNATGGYPAGCDDGPHVEGFGNMIYWNGAWTTLTALNAGLTFNWAVQAYLEMMGETIILDPVVEKPGMIVNTDHLTLRPEPILPPAIFVPDNYNRSLWYNVYWNDEVVATVEETSYSGSEIESGLNTYYITAFYVNGPESDPSNFEYVILNSVDETTVGFFLIYPNPATGLFNIRSESPLKMVKLYNAFGQVVYSTSTDEVELQVNTTKFAGGIYTVQVETAGRITTQKIVIQ